MVHPDLNVLDNASFEALLQPLAEFLAVRHPVDKTDIIFVFGSLKLPAVWQHAARLFLDGLAPTVIVTGGIGKKNAMDRSLFQLGDRTEASFLQDQLVALGVPETSIIKEETSTNTLENILFGMKILKEKTVPADKLLLVSKPFHMRRCLATFQQQFPSATFICAPPPISFQDSIDRPRDQFAERLLAEVERLRIYAAKGDIRSQEIPTEVELAIKEVQTYLQK